MFVYSLTSVAKLGQFDKKFGQRYWCEATESDLPIMFNSMNQEIDVGDVITAEETANGRSAKGTDYLKLKKVKLGERAEPPEQPATQSIATGEGHIMKALRELFAHQKVLESKLDQLLGNDIDLLEKPTKTPQNKPDTVYDMEGDPIPEMPEDFLKVEDD